MAAKVINPVDLESFAAHLLKSKRVFALCGAGLSASSGLHTFRGVGGMWKTHDAMSLATPEAFDADPSLVWQFYAARRKAAFSAKPNPAHYALAEYARKNKDFITVTQNVDGLSPRAHHPSSTLYPCHGLLSTIKCVSFDCTYTEENNYSLTLCPGLGPENTSLEQTSHNEDAEPLDIPIEDLPHCPACKSGLLRPGVVWFGESLPEKMMTEIDDWLDEGRIDLCLVIGTSGRVYPAAEYIKRCKRKGAKVAIINLEIANDPELGGVEHADWLFEGDAAKVLPEILKPVIGQLDIPDTDETFPKLEKFGGPIYTNRERNDVGMGGYH